KFNFTTMDSATLIGLTIAFIAVIGTISIAIWFILARLRDRKEENIAKIENRSRERMALIEKGMDPNLADKAPEKNHSGSFLLIGLIIVFACIGRIIAFFSSFHLGSDDKTFVLVLPAFFAGLAFLVYHFYRRGFFSRKNK
ncbi:MAG: hypothetical protein Q8868_12825, partial [Bacteroidota bacterium]|nr:hypothetical protein [Bacteroidota bacterium]